MKLFRTIVCTSILVAAPMAIGEEPSNTPKQETLAEAIRFEKHKIAAAEAQARKDAAEAARSSQPTQNKTARSTKNTRKTGQADKPTKK